MASLTIFRGLPGSGKSTAARNCLNVDFVFEADDYFKMWPWRNIDVEGSDYYWFDHNELALAHNWCFFRTQKALSLGYNVAVSNTFVKVWEMEKYIHLCERANYELKVYTCTNEYKSVHNVPEATIENMKRRWEPYEGEIFL